MAPDTKATGSKTCSMGLEKKSGRTEADIRETISKGRSMVKGPTFGLTGAFMTVTGTKIELKVMAHTRGLTVDSTPVNGRIIICMATGLMCGKMDASMKAFTSSIRSMGTESTSGPMGASTKGTGR